MALLELIQGNYDRAIFIEKMNAELKKIDVNGTFGGKNDPENDDH